MAPSKDGFLQQINPLDLNALDSVQKEALQELKLRFKESAEPTQGYLQDEYYLIYWLKARKFDVSRAEAMLQNHIRYRNALKMDSPEYAQFKVHPVMAQYYTRGRFGFTKLGHPIVYFPFGGIDPKGVIYSVKMSDFYRAIMKWQEQRRISCIEASKQLGKRIQQVVYIFDLKGIGTKHLWPTGLEVFQQIAKMVEQHTPEIIYKAKVINAPSLFYAIFKIVKPILDENTLRKVQIFGTEGWKEALLEEIDKDQLPVYYGGTAVGIDGDIKCEHATTGKKSHRIYFRSDFLLAVVKVHLVKRSIGNYPCHINDFSWYFESQSGHDLGFAVYRIPDDLISKSNQNTNDINNNVTLTKSTDVTKDYEMIYPYFRLLTHIIPEWGHIEVQQPGTYVVQFDNSYSWIYSKNIQYFVTVQSADRDLLKCLPLTEN